MTTALLALALWIPVSPARAQDHLQPELGDLFGYRLLDVFSDYHHTVREQLLTIDEEPYVAAIELPGFSPEWALVLDRAGYERISPVAECFDLPPDSGDELLGPDHCPESSAKSEPGRPH